jgi:hypothetical protein
VRACSAHIYVYMRTGGKLSRLGSSIVTMVEASQSLMRKDPTPTYRTNPAVRRPLPESKMRAVLMVVTNILREHSLQMALIHRDNVVQQVSSAAFDPTLRHTVLRRISAPVQRKSRLNMPKSYNRSTIGNIVVSC